MKRVEDSLLIRLLEVEDAGRIYFERSCGSDIICWFDSILQ